MLHELRENCLAKVHPSLSAIDAAGYRPHLGAIFDQKSSNRKENEKKKLEIELRDMVLNTIEQKVSSMLDKNNKYYDFIEKLVNKKTDPFEAAEEVIRTMSW